ncbi:MAG: hypothetical protein AAGF54_12270 [Pseudomonadota bacterium]
MVSIVLFKNNVCGVSERARRYSFLVCLLLVAWFFSASSTIAQVTTPPNINGGNAIGVNNLGGTTGGTQNFGSLAGLGSNQGETFTFTGQPTGGGQWNGGFSFLNANILQFQANLTPLPASPVNYTLTFPGNEVYGLQFRMSGLDFADETTITFFNNGVAVPITVSTYVNGAVTVPRAGNIITFAGTNIDIDPSGNGFRADGDGNNDTGGIGIHGFQEGFSIALPLNVPVDEVRFSTTGKNDSTNGNVTLILTDFAWARPDIGVTKASTFSQGGNGESNVGDIVTYTYIVTNNGNVPLSNITLTETGFTGTGTTPVPVFSSGTNGATPANFPQGESLTYTASYPATASDLLAGSIDNQGTVSALPNGGTIGTSEVSDLSDSSNAGDGGAIGSLDEDDPTTTTFPAPIVFNPSIEAVKVSDTSNFTNPALPGQTIIYTITIANTGDVDLNSINLSDTLTNGSGTILSPPAPTFVSSSLGSPVGSLIVGETATYSFTYALLQTDIDSASLSNTVTATATPFTGGSVADVSDDGDDGDGNTVDDPTVDQIGVNAAMQVTKIASQDTNVSVGQTVTYTYRVTNTGNQTITAIILSDAHGGSGTPPTPGSETLFLDNGPINDSNDAVSGDGIWDSLAPGDVIQFLASYVVTQQDVDTLQ